jgi:hypothetical protein
MIALSDSNNQTENQQGKIKLYYVRDAELLLHINRKFTMGNRNHLFCRNVSFSLLISRCSSRYESMMLYLRCLLFLVQMDRMTPSIECVVILIILVVWSVDPKY